MNYKSLGVLCLLLVAGPVACSSKEKPPLVASSAGQAGYAERYPEALAATRNRFGEQQSRADELMGQFQGYPDALDDPDWAGVKTVVEQADAAGSSAAYVERLDEAEHVMRFYEEEKPEIDKKVGGAAAYTAKQKGCSDTLAIGGAATRSLEKTIEKRLEERMRDHNPAHRYIEDNEESLGKKNFDTLKQQADEISHASYLVKVGTERTRRELQAKIAEAEEVQKTLDRTIEEQGKIASSDASDARKQAAQERKRAAVNAKNAIESEVEQTKQALSELEQRREKLLERYQKALEQLLKKLDERSSTTPPPADA